MPALTGSVASTVVPLRNTTVPVAVVASALVGFSTVAFKVTATPCTCGLEGVVLRVVSDVVAGGDGSGSVPCRLRTRLLPLLPANVESSELAARLHVVVLKSGIENVVSERVTSLVLVSYGVVERSETSTGEATHFCVTGEVMCTSIDSVSL